MLKDVGMAVPKKKQDPQIMHTRQCQTNNITSYSSEFSSCYHKNELQFMHACRQGIIACNNNNMRNPAHEIKCREGLHMLLLLNAIIPCLHAFIFVVA